MSRKRTSEKQRMRDYIERLRTERGFLAALALPNHRNGGFFSPRILWRAQEIATDVLEGRGSEMEPTAATASVPVPEAPSDGN